MLTISVCHVVEVISIADGRRRHMFFFRDNDKADAMLLQDILVEYFDNYWSNRQFVNLTSVIIAEDDTRFICDGIEFLQKEVLMKMKNTQDAMKKHDVMIRLGEPPLGIFHRAHWACKCLCCCLCCCLLSAPSSRQENQCSFK